MPLKKSKSRTIIRTENGHRIDLKSKQLLYFECDVETVKFVPLKSYEDFTPEGAKYVFDKYKNKRQSRSILYCLTDRIRFEKRAKIGKNPFRKDLTYREIRHFFVFPEDNRIFMLCVSDEFGKKSFELYRCKPEDVNTICDLTYSASNDPQHIIRDIETMKKNLVSMSDQELSPSTATYRSNNGLYQVGQDVQPDETANGNYRNEYMPSNSESFNESIHSVDIFPNYAEHYTMQRANNSRAQIGHNDLSTKRSKSTNVTGVYSYYDKEFAPKYRETFDRSPCKASDMLIESKPGRGPLFGTTNSEMYLNRRSESSPPHTEKTITVSMKSKTDIREYRGSRSVPINQYNKEPIKIVRDYPQPAHSRTRLFHSSLDLCCKDEITFIGNNLTDGTHVSEFGPVYMYITRYESQQNVSNLKEEKPLRTLNYMSPFLENGESDIFTGN